MRADLGQFLRNLAYGGMTLPVRFALWVDGQWNPTDAQSLQLKGTLEQALLQVFQQAQGLGPAPSVPGPSWGPPGTP